MREIKRHKRFKKDFSRVKFSDSQFQKFLQYLNILIENKELPKEALNHTLKGEWKDCREFHLGGDLIVVYLIDGNEIILIAIGSHNQVFNE